MRHSLFLLCIAVLLMPFVSPAQAEVIRWGYSWSINPGEIPSSGMGTGGVVFILSRAGQATGSVNLVATELGSFAAPSVGCHNPERIANAHYELKLQLVDQASRAKGTLTFDGILNGTLSATDASLTNRFVSRTTQALHLGHHWYWVSLGPFTGPVGATPGQIKAHVQVKDNPEPSGLGLMLLGLAGIGGWSWWRVRRKRPWTAR
jgi:hypothetical protein